PQPESEGGAMAGLGGGVLGNGAVWIGVAAAIALAHVAREPARRLVLAIFDSGGDILERFAAATLGLGRGLFADARAALALWEREELSQEAAVRQKELVDVLERFGGLEARYEAAARTLKDAADAKGRERGLDRVVALLARMTAGQERFNANVQYVTEH